MKTFLVRVFDSTPEWLKCFLAAVWFIEGIKYLIADGRWLWRALMFIH